MAWLGLADYTWCFMFAGIVCCCAPCVVLPMLDTKQAFEALLSYLPGPDDEEYEAFHGDDDAKTRRREALKSQREKDKKIIEGLKKGFIYYSLISSELLVLGFFILDYQQTYKTLGILYACTCFVYGLSIYFCSSVHLDLDDGDRDDMIDGLTNEHREIRLDSAYTDFTSPHFQNLFTVFVPQIIAIVLYVEQLMKPIQIRMGDVSLRYAILGVFFAPLFFKKGLRKAYFTKPYQRALFVRYVFEPFTHIGLKGDHTKYDDRKKDLKPYGISFRCFLDLLINLGFATFVLVTMPVFLAHSSDNINFVLSSMSMLFVLGIDDLDKDDIIVVTFYKCSSRHPGTFYNSDHDIEPSVDGPVKKPSEEKPAEDDETAEPSPIAPIDKEL